MQHNGQHLSEAWAGILLFLIHCEHVQPYQPATKHVRPPLASTSAGELLLVQPEQGASRKSQGLQLLPGEVRHSIPIAHTFLFIVVTCSRIYVLVHCGILVSAMRPAGKSPAHSHESRTEVGLGSSIPATHIPFL